MTLRLAESWQSSIFQTPLVRKGWVSAPSAGSTLTLTTGCHGGVDDNDLSLFMSSGGSMAWGDTDNSGLGSTFNASLGTTIICGAHIKTTGGTANSFWEWRDAAFATIAHLDADTSTGTFRLYRGSGTSNLIATSSAGAFALDNLFHMYECKMVINSSTGSIDVHRDTVSVFSASGLNTQGVAGDCYILSWQNTNGSWYYQDLYICDNAGSVNNDFLGDIRVEGRLVNGAGNYTQLTPSTGSNFQNVDDPIFNLDGDYNFSSIIGQKDSYAMQDLHSTSGTVLAVNVWGIARKTDTPPRGFKVFCRSSGTDGAQSTERLLLNDFTWSGARKMYETDPATGAAWTISAVNAIEAGVVVSS